MNIFFLSLDPKICAQYHCNKHVVKMILETAQLLCTCFQLLISDDKKIIDYSNAPKLYRPTFKNHPMCIWTRKNISNYKWLLNLGKELCIEYTHRYKKIHSSQVLLNWLYEQCFTYSIPSENHFKSLHSPYKSDQSFAVCHLPPNCTRVPLCMPDKYKHNSLLSAYRHYYIGDKIEFAKWKDRDIPDWFVSKNYSI